MVKLPTQADILEWIRAHPEKSSKRDIAKAFGIKGAARINLKQTLKELEAEGHISQRRRRFSDPDTLPPVSVLQMLGPDDQGDMFAVPLEWEGTGILPKVLMQMRSGEPTLGQGDRILARVTTIEDEEGHQYTGQIIRAIGTNPKNVAAAAFLRDFVAEAKQSGLVASLIEKHGVEGRLLVASGT